MLKKLFMIIAFLSQTFYVLADEGMWILSLLKKQEAAMQAKGLKLSADDIYNVNSSSLKDAIVWFNGGCTGEIISDQGLVLTNHHCGYDAIASLSTTSDNILDNGFYASNKQNERKTKDPLSVSILMSIDDVTDKVLAELESISDFSLRATKLRELSTKFTAEYGKGDKNLDVRLYDMFKGNQFFVFVYEKFTDVRLVGTPPQNVGKFGGDTDNWMWPRHTGDFSLFRIYADKNNKPAPYSEENVPYKPKHHLPVSLKGVSEGDFAMIVGFPGRTNRYEFADAVQLGLDETNGAIVDMRNIRLTEWREIMNQDLQTRLDLSSQYARVANYWKYFIGQTEQLNRLKVVDAKKQEELAFASWGANNELYRNVLSDVQIAVDSYKPYAKHLYYLSEGLFNIELVKFGNNLVAYYKALESGNEEQINQTKERFIKLINDADRNPLIWSADQKIFSRMLTKYYNDIPKNQHPAFITNIAKKYKFNKNLEAGIAKFTADFYKKNPFTSKSNALKFVEKATIKSIAKLDAFKLSNGLINMYSDVIIPEYRKYSATLGANGNVYMRGLMEMQPNRDFYPDANSSIRLTYGSVEGYYSSDAIKYKHFTTMRGVMEKYVPGDIEFDLPSRLIELESRKEYGQYADKDGSLHVNFLSNNDITGGNSGSPVIDGEGNIIGLAFDGNWEAMSGDIYFDAKYKRTINVDIRYVLWCIDILGQAPHIVKEMTIVK